MIKNKERALWIFLLIFVLAISFFNFKSPSIAIAQQGRAQSDNDFYYYSRLFQKVFATLQQNFVDTNNVTTKKLMYGAIKGMLEATDDPFTFLLDEKLNEALSTEMSGRYGGVGLSISKQPDKGLMVVAPIEDGPGEKAGILPGDIITAIDGKSTKDMAVDTAANIMRGKEGTKVTLTIVRDGVPDSIEYPLTRALIEIKSVKYKMLDNTIGYIRITTFGDDTSKELDTALKDLKKSGMKKLILDLRNNPGGRLDTAINIVEEFLSDGKIVYTRGRTRNENQDYFASRKGDEWINGDMLVLVNQYSASASEILAGALQDNNRAKLLGETTFGKFSVQYVLPLDSRDNTSFKFTVAHYYTPNGRRLHGKGITPDYVVVEEKLSNSDITALTELRKSGEISSYVKRYPNESSDASALPRFKEELRNKNIIPSDYLLERLIYNERNLGNYNEIVDMRYDKQLKAAINYLETGREPPQDKEEPRENWSNESEE